MPYVRPLRERFGELPRDIWVVQAGTAVSRRVRGAIPNSVNLLRYRHEVQPRRCIVERWDHEARAQRFTCVDQNALYLTASIRR